MALRLIVDGYNYICAAMGLSGSHPGMMDSGFEREELIEKLQVYKRMKRVKITVVFDGARSGKLARNKESHKGIEVIYSRGGEEADTIIKEMAKAQGKGLTIVTSDRELGGVCTNYGAVIIRSGEFFDLLELAIYSDIKGLDGEEDMDDSNHSPGGKRKGNPRKPSKKDREKLKKLKKL